MTLYIVSYDLKKPGKDYKGLYEELKKSPKWWHYLESTWLIHTNETADQLFDRLRSHIDENDYVLVTEVTRNRSGWLPRKAWDWFGEIQH